MNILCIHNKISRKHTFGAGDILGSDVQGCFSLANVFLKWISILKRIGILYIRTLQNYDDVFWVPMNSSLKPLNSLIRQRLWVVINSGVIWHHLLSENEGFIVWKMMISYDNGGKRLIRMMTYYILSCNIAVHIDSSALEQINIDILR